MNNLTANLENVRARVSKACKNAGREPSTVTILAVSKKHPASRIRALHGLGQAAFGENYVQEALAKQSELQDLVIEWHFIGPLQSNKTREVSAHFAWAQSVDRNKIVRRLSEQRPDSLGELNVCIQVNVDEEASKSGAAVGDVAELAHAVAQLPRLRLRGLMCLPAMRESFDEQRLPFARTRELAEDLARGGLALDTLSMGMSDDFRAAIMEGATIVRIGTAVFGPRNT